MKSKLDNDISVSNENEEIDTDENDKKRYYTVKQLVEREEFDAFSEASIRWYIFEDTNNFNKCILRINRKLLIDLEEFRAWIASHKQGGLK